jgi:hypothetical protein
VSGHSSVGRSHCQNCGAPLGGPYCSACGQHDVDYHRSLWPIVEDSLEGFLHFDGKFFRTVRWLFTRPGFLTKEFIAGRRVSYTQPLRLYIFASFLYFAAGFAFNSGESPPAPVSVKANAADARNAAAEKNAASQDASKPAAPAKGAGFLDRIQHEDPTELMAELRHLAPTMAFFCIPFLATLLSLTYRKCGRVYVEHLIFALHIQAFIFLCALATGALQAMVRPFSLSLAELIGFLAFIGGWYLNYRAFRGVYGQGRWITFLKVVFVGAAYGIILSVGIVMISLAAALIVMK